MSDKIPFYNFLNMFLIGITYLFLSFALYYDKILGFVKTSSIDFNIFFNSGITVIITTVFFSLCYLVGLIINRIGSLIIEEILLKFRFIKIDYNSFNEKKEKYKILDIMSREYSLSRTLVAMFLLIFINSIFVTNYLWMIITCLLLILFLFSMKKFNRRIIQILDSK